MKSSQLGCEGAAQAGAEAIERQFPSVVFTSGRRGVVDQARAMSQNVVKNHHWIRETYTATAESQTLQAWVDGHPQERSAPAIQAGLQSIMEVWTDEERARLSLHFAGRAWDIQPMQGELGHRVMAAIRRLPGLGKFLDHEGGLPRWHAQFH